MGYISKFIMPGVLDVLSRNIELTSTYADTSVSTSIDTQFFSGSSTCIFVENSSLVIQIKRKLNFMDTEAFDLLLKDEQLLSFINDALKTLDESGKFYTADLQILKDVDNDSSKLILIYRLIDVKDNTSVSQNIFATPSTNNLYKEIIKKLFAYPKSIRKTVIIDEMPI